jgi:hypothetical protein
LSILSNKNNTKQVSIKLNVRKNISMDFFKPESRAQVSFGSLDELIPAEHQARFLDAFGKVTKKRTSLFWFYLNSEDVWLAVLLNQKVRGWILYFGKYAHSSMVKIYAHINFRLVKWCKTKYKKFTGAAITWLRQKWKEKPHLFAYWEQTKWFCYPFTPKRYS